VIARRQTARAAGAGFDAAQAAPPWGARASMGLQMISTLRCRLIYLPRSTAVTMHLLLDTHAFCGGGRAAQVQC